jgi:hypothetical protein
MYGQQGPQYPYQHGMVQAYPVGMLQCPRCGFVGQPIGVTKISVAGWIVFTILLLVCFPLFWIGLLMKETTTRCPRCLQ